VGKGRKTVNLNTTMIKASHRKWLIACLGLTCIPEETVPIPDFTFPRLSYVKYTDAEADVVKDAISIFLVELIDKGLFWGKAELRRVYRYFVLCWPSMRKRG
jgi:hypothetical protein